MDISPTGAPTMPMLGQPQANALEGMMDAQARVQDAASQLAAGNLDPAVVVSVTSAQMDFAANAKVMQTAQENTNRLLDMLA